MASWPDYQRESTISETEQKKLGPLALRLVERLQGPALQVTELAKPDGAKLLLALRD